MTTTMRAGLFVLADDEAGLAARACPRDWFYLRVADATAVRRALDRLAVAGVVVSERHTEAPSLVAEVVSRGVPVLVLTDENAAVWRERGAVADGASHLAQRLEEMALAAWAEQTT